jgi:ADP-ribose pyrophosphatase YjhB (NUDIX family)
MTTAVFHPKKDDKDRLVRLHSPSTASPLDSWLDPRKVASVVPGGLMPVELNGVPFRAWTEAPNEEDDWAQVDGQHGGLFDEPIFTPTPGKRTAAGVVIEEADNRVWVVHPSNAFGGYEATFPKGTLGCNSTLQATAIMEAFEESGLQVVITGYFADSERSQSKTRYYFARRICGSPADMGWESQKVSLIPLSMLGDILTHPNDAPLVRALQQESRPARRHIIKYEFGLTSGFRILATINGFRQKYGVWPHRLLMDTVMADTLRKDILTSLGWAMMEKKLEIVPTRDGSVVAEGNDASRCDYNTDPVEHIPTEEHRADEWLWGTRV